MVSWVSFLFECIFAITTGQGFAVILINVTRYITLFTFSLGENSSNPQIKKNKFFESLKFFTFFGFICFLFVICIISLYRNKYFIKKRNAFYVDREKNDLEKIEINSKSDLLKNSKVNFLTKSENEEEKVFPYIWDLAALIFITYSTAFAVYPGLTISYKLL